MENQEPPPVTTTTEESSPTTTTGAEDVANVAKLAIVVGVPCLTQTQTTTHITTTTHSTTKNATAVHTQSNLFTLDSIPASVDTINHPLVTKVFQRKNEPPLVLLVKEVIDEQDSSTQTPQHASNPTEKPAQDTGFLPTDSSASDMLEIHSYSRKDKSLSVLCHHFLQLYCVKGQEICLHKATSKLSAAVGTRVERRRIYDIVNVLESVHVLERRGKNKYSWLGVSNITAGLEKIQKEGPISLEGICDDDDDDSPSNGSNSNNSNKYPKPSQAGPPDAPFFTETRRENSLSNLSRAFISLFLKGSFDVVSLEDAAVKLLGGGAEKHKNQTTPKVRRLYDIANVLTSIGLIRKIKSPYSRKPAYQWAGPAHVIGANKRPPQTEGGANSSAKRLRLTATTPALDLLSKPLTTQQSALTNALAQRLIAGNTTFGNNTTTTLIAPTTTTTTTTTTTCITTPTTNNGNGQLVGLARGGLRQQGVIGLGAPSSTAVCPSPATGASPLQKSVGVLSANAQAFLSNLPVPAQTPLFTGLQQPQPQQIATTQPHGVVVASPRSIEPVLPAATQSQVESGTNVAVGAVSQQRANPLSDTQAVLLDTQAVLSRLKAVITTPQQATGTLRTQVHSFVPSPQQQQQHQQP